MLKATDEEIEEVREYFEWQAPDLEVTFMQKVYSEAVLNTRHDVWDIHTNKNRWWVITGGTNLYSQGQFPNMDLALTFLQACLTVPGREYFPRYVMSTLVEKEAIIRERATSRGRHRRRRPVERGDLSDSRRRQFVKGAGMYVWDDGCSPHVFATNEQSGSAHHAPVLTLETPGRGRQL